MNAIDRSRTKKTVAKTRTTCIIERCAKRSDDEGNNVDVEHKENHRHEVYERGKIVLHASIIKTVTKTGPMDNRVVKTITPTPNYD